MNTKSPDNTEPNPSRRWFLKKVAAFAGSTLASYGITKTALDTLSPPAAKAQTSETPAEIIPEPETAVEQPAQKLISTEEKLFTNYSSEERTFTEQEITVYKTRYEKANDQDRADRVLDWEKSTIRPILDLDVKEDQEFWKELLSAIVYVESEGKNMAVSNIGALGLAQLTKATAAGVQEQHKDKISKNYNLNIGWDNLRLSRFLLVDLISRFGPDLFFIGYYAGEPTADSMILAALSRAGVPSSDSIMEKGISSNNQLRYYIDHYQINIANLGSEDGVEYVAKTVAAMRILQEARLQTTS